MKVKLHLYFIWISIIQNINSEELIHKRTAIDSFGSSLTFRDLFSKTIKSNEESENPLQRREKKRKSENIRTVKSVKNVTSALQKKNTDRKRRNVQGRNESKKKSFPQKRKSEIMCEKYAKMLKITIWVQYPTNFDPVPISLLSCNKYWGGLINPLIGGGDTALFGEFPHMAVLAYEHSNGEARYVCAASLISEKWLLTSAHCSYKILLESAFVYLGSNNLMDSDSGQVVDVKRLKIHPDFEPRVAYADIALIELKNPVLFGTSLKPACLDVDSLEKENSPKLVATGWGAPYYGGDLSPNLMKTELDVINNVDCSKLYNNSVNLPNGIVESLMCAGDLTGDSDTCSGDSGSPLQDHHPTNCLYKIIAITSAGKYCGIDKVPGIYTRIAPYIDWIEEIVWPDSGS